VLTAALRIVYGFLTALHFKSTNVYAVPNALTAKSPLEGYPLFLALALVPVDSTLGSKLSKAGRFWKALVGSSTDHLFCATPDPVAHF
jgi:hypothetical protein